MRAHAPRPEAALLKWAGVCLVVGVVAIWVLLVTGCAFPQWRVFQAKIDPKLAEKPAPQVEAERRSAALIADLSAVPTANPVGRIAEIHAVAVPLSASLGEPLKRATVFEAPNVIADQRAGIVSAQARADKWKEFATKYAGKPVEDTGINLAGPMGILGLLAVIAACIACPALGYMVLRFLPVLWGFFRTSTAGISNFIAENPEAGEELKSNLTRKMDRPHKRLVKLFATPAEKLP